jgi:hypothetical protein
MSFVPRGSVDFRRDWSIMTHNDPQSHKTQRCTTERSVVDLSVVHLWVLCDPRLTRSCSMARKANQRINSNFEVIFFEVGVSDILGILGLLAHKTNKAKHCANTNQELQQTMMSTAALRQTIVRHGRRTMSTLALPADVGLMQRMAGVSRRLTASQRVRENITSYSFDALLFTTLLSFKINLERKHGGSPLPFVHTH